jgi:hypothetical protein
MMLVCSREHLPRPASGPLLALVPRAALLLAAAAAVSVGIVLGSGACSEDEPPARAAAPGPAQAVREYAAHLRAGRYREACAYQTWSRAADVRDECVRQLRAAGVDTAEFNLTIAAVRVDGPNAEVDVFGSAKATIVLEKQAGRWLVASYERRDQGPAS